MAVEVEWRGRSGLAGDVDAITFDDAIPAGFIADVVILILVVGLLGFFFFFSLSLYGEFFFFNGFCFLSSNHEAGPE